MKNERQNFLSALTILGKRYVKEFLSEININRLRRNWYESFKFFLSRVYYQGRSDSLSEKYLLSMNSCLDKFFLRNSTKTLETLSQSNHIPHNIDWKNFNKNQSILFNQFNDTMGKPRDLEMVMDILRYLCSFSGHNIVNRSLEEIEKGRIKPHRNELMEIRGVGPKTSAFYLRDVFLLFNCKIGLSEAREIQPIDTWVKRVVRSIQDNHPDETDLSHEDWIVKYARTSINSALINAGAWYLGFHS